MVEINQENQFGLHPIRADKRKIAEKNIENFKRDWIFDKPIEKIIISVSFMWTIYSIIKFIWGLF